ncbi:MAG TPA: DedA family protein [Ktedonobacterales bacterium]|nr:DedA family protein [Ktedonobacterales bacterium]
MQSFISGLGTVPSPLIDLFVFVWLAAESCGIPLPNELVLLLAGSIAAQRGDPLGMVELVLTATAGSLVGATAAYFIGVRGGRAAILRLGRFVRLDERRLDMVEQWFSRSGAFAIAVARLTPFVRTVSSFPAGILRMPPRAFYTATLIGSLLWCSVLVGAGYLLGVHYMVAVDLIQRYTLPAIVVLVALIAAYLWLHQRLTHLGQPAKSSAPATSTRPRNSVKR